MSCTHLPIPVRQSTKGTVASVLVKVPRHSEMWVCMVIHILDSQKSFMMNEVRTIILLAVQLLGTVQIAGALLCTLVKVLDREKCHNKKT